MTTFPYSPWCKIANNYPSSDKMSSVNLQSSYQHQPRPATIISSVSAKGDLYLKPDSNWGCDRCPPMLRVESKNIKYYDHDYDYEEDYLIYGKKLNKEGIPEGETVSMRFYRRDDSYGYPIFWKIEGAGITENDFELVDFESDPYFKTLFPEYGWIDGELELIDRKAEFLTRHPRLHEGKISLSGAIVKGSDWDWDHSFFLKIADDHSTNNEGTEEFTMSISHDRNFEHIEDRIQLKILDTSKGTQNHTFSITRPKAFKRKAATKIKEFNPLLDTLQISLESFDIDHSSVTFKASKNRKKLRKHGKKYFNFIYDQAKGGLYFNENGADKGFGDGGLIAILKGAPDLTQNHLEFI